MKILIVNTYDRGGAANSCKRLHLGLLDASVDSKLLLKNKENDWPESYKFKPVESNPYFQERLRRKIRRLAQELKISKSKKELNPKDEFLKSRPEGLELFSFPDSNLDITQSPLYKEADIINLHWVANFLDLESFFKNNTKPVVWTLHDMNPFTGGEHYEEKFLRINKDGEPIQRRLLDQEIKISETNIELKKKVFAQLENFNIVAPSKWLANEAMKSAIFREFPVLHIPNGVDSDIFKPLDKKYSREILNIPKEKKVILFVADSLGNNRKGYVFLTEAFKKLDQEKLVLCAIGKTNSEFSSENLIELGSIKDERLMSVAYSAADVFVIPSLMDNLPNTVLESLMCGTPVIGFPVGGIPEMIIHRKNGLLTKEISVNALAETLRKFLKNPNMFDRSKIRENALSKYDQRIQAENYLTLFRSILKENN